VLWLGRRVALSKPFMRKAPQACPELGLTSVPSVACPLPSPPPPPPSARR
jgi:hypothetical protein